MYQNFIPKNAIINIHKNIQHQMETNNLNEFVPFIIHHYKYIRLTNEK